MKINKFYEKEEYIDILSYLHKSGIDDAEEFIEPTGKYIENPMLFKNIEKGIDLIKKYLTKKIYILVDCDVDGYMSSAELYLYLTQINPSISIDVLFHENKLHGLDDENIMKYLLESSPSLLIIPDASGNDEQYKILRDIGYEILCIDHHLTKDSNYAITINNQLSPNIINKQGAGSIVTHQFLRALDIEFNVKYAMLYIEFAMLGNIADSMDMNNIYNRSYNYYGFRRIKNKFISDLIDNFISRDLNPHEISFSISPKFNSVIRSDNMQLKRNIFYSLVGKTKDDNIITECEKCHKNQISLVTEISNNIIPLIKDTDKINIISSDDIPKSYSGLIAGKISGNTNKPAVIVKKYNDDMYIGSVRSPIPVKDIFNKSKYCDWAKGHDNSMGIQINNLHKFKEYCETLELSIDTVINVTQSFDANKNIPSYLFKEFSKYDELWGKGLEKPKYHLFKIKLNNDNIKILGKHKTTFSFTYNNLKYIKFFCSYDFIVNVLKMEEYQKWNKYKNQYEKDFKGTYTVLDVELIGYFGFNEYKGVFTQQVEIKQIEVLETPQIINTSWENVF